MSRVEDYAQAVHRFRWEPAPEVHVLLLAVLDAWVQAEASPISEHEAQRWSRVCSAAETVAGVVS